MAMTPGEVITARAECYANNDFTGVYALYSSRSEFLRYFRTAEQYINEAKSFQAKNPQFMRVKILDEKSRGKLAVVTFRENVIDRNTGESLMNYITTATLIRDADGEWRVLEERRANFV